MLGFFILLVLAASIAIYASTSYAKYTLVPNREKRLYVSAYGLLGISAFIWATTFFVPENTVPQLVFASDILILAGTVCMIGIFLNLTRPQFILPITLVVASIITLRAYTSPSTAYIKENLLIFNLTYEVSLIIGLVFLLIWLPATIKIIHLALSSSALAPYRSLVSFLFMSVVLMTSYSLMAVRPLMVIASFVSMIIFFMILTSLNLTISRLDKAQTNKKA